MPEKRLPQVAPGWGCPTWRRSPPSFQGIAICAQHASESWHAMPRYADSAITGRQSVFPICLLGVFSGSGFFLSHCFGALPLCSTAALAVTCANCGAKSNAKVIGNLRGHNVRLGSNDSLSTEVAHL